jgi:hypothetical protein
MITFPKLNVCVPDSGLIHRLARWSLSVGADVVSAVSGSIGERGSLPLTIRSSSPHLSKLGVFAHTSQFPLRANDRGDWQNGSAPVGGLDRERWVTGDGWAPRAAPGGSACPNPRQPPARRRHSEPCASMANGRKCHTRSRIRQNAGLRWFARILANTGTNRTFAAARL